MGCPECSNEWSAVEAKDDKTDVIEVDDGLIRDANGNVLSDGGDGHDIACKIDGIGAINLKSEFVRKA
jgi:protein PhnA